MNLQTNKQLSHMTYGLLLWGNQVEQVSIQLIIGSEYLAHSEPLFKELELLKIEDLYKLKILNVTIIYIVVCYHHILIVILIY